MSFIPNRNSKCKYKDCEEIILGTSRQKIKANIKNILINTNHSELEFKFPDLSQKVLTTRALNRAFINESNIYSILNFLNTEISKEVDVSNTLTRDQFINDLIDSLEAEHSIQLNDILEKSIRIGLADTFSKPEIGIEMLASNIFTNVIREMLKEDLVDTSISVYKELDTEKIEQIIESATKKITDASFDNTIKEFVNNKKSLKNVIDFIKDKINDSTLGEF